MKPNEFWFAWYSLLYRQHTRHLTERQDLYYRRMIEEYMETGEPLPADSISLAFICRTTVEIWEENAEVIKRFFKEKDGFLYHNFCDDQLDIQDRKAKRRTSIGKKAAKKRWEKNTSKQEDECIQHALPIADAMPNDATGQDRTGQDRTREDSNLVNHRTKKPSLVPDASPPAQPKKQASRLSEDWELDEDAGKWAMGKGLTKAEVLKEAEKFKNYWLAKPGKAGLKLDWLAAWRTWILNALDFKR